MYKITEKLGYITMKIQEAGFHSWNLYPYKDHNGEDWIYIGLLFFTNDGRCIKTCTGISAKEAVLCTPSIIDARLKDARNALNKSTEGKKAKISPNPNRFTIGSWGSIWAQAGEIINAPCTE